MPATEQRKEFTDLGLELGEREMSKSPAIPQP